MGGFGNTLRTEADDHNQALPDGTMPREDAGPSEDSEQSSNETAEQGARRLLIAILHEAVYCYQKYMFTQSQRHRRLFREVQRWFNVHDTGAPLSFEYVCRVLRIDPDYFRRGLKKWRSCHKAGQTKRDRHGVPRREPPVSLCGRDGSARRSNGATRSDIEREFGDCDPDEG